MDEEEKILNNFINEVLEDIELSGMDYEAIAIIGRQSQRIRDYILEPEEISNIDEITEKLSLFTILAYLTAIELKSSFTPDGCIIKATRLVKKMTQKQFAIEIQETDRAIKSWEQGSRIPKIDTFLKCIKSLNCKYNDFFKTYTFLKENLIKKEI